MVCGGKVTNQTNSTKGKNQAKTTKSKNLIRSKNHDFPPNFRNIEVGPSFHTPKARLAFTILRQAFVKALILYYCDLKCHIGIETHESGYAIGKILSKLTLNDLGWWHLVIFFSRKIILAKTRYRIHDGKLLAILKDFKTKKHYLEDYIHEILVLTGYNNFWQFIDAKSLSSRQVHWV